MDYHPGLTYKTIFIITCVADQMAFSHKPDDQNYERRLTAHARLWFLTHYPPHGEPEDR